MLFVNVKSFKPQLNVHNKKIVNGQQLVRIKSVTISLKNQNVIEHLAVLGIIIYNNVPNSLLVLIIM